MAGPRVRPEVAQPPCSGHIPGARMTLQYALERKVTEALGRSYYENAPATTKEKGRRNGYESVVDLRNQIALASEGDYAVLADHGIFSIDGTNRLAQN